jgi:hypothetical protein
MRSPTVARRFRVSEALMAGAMCVPAVWSRAWGAMALVTASWIFAAVAGGVVAHLTAAASTLIAWAAANRVAIFGAEATANGLGPGGLQFGRAELGIPFAAALNLVFLAMIASVLGLVALAIAGASELNAEAIQARDWAEAGATWKLTVVGGVTAVSLAILTVLIVRLSLFSQATVGRGQPVSLNTMGIATGSFWRLLTLLVILIAPLVSVATAVDGDVAGRGAFAAAFAGLWLPFAAGAMGAAYRGLEYWKPGEG